MIIFQSFVSVFKKKLLINIDTEAKTFMTNKIQKTVPFNINI